MSECESCGVDWSEHLGMIGTCKRVQEQAAEIERLKAEIERLHKFERDRYTGWAQQLFILKQDAIASASCNDPQEHPIGEPKMLVCKTCGNKRCPAAGDERMMCRGSNEPGQIGEKRS